MSTIAWDGSNLSADSRVTYGGTQGEFQKIKRLKNGWLFASCGKAMDFAAVAHWLEDIEPGVLHNSMAPRPKVDDEFLAMLISNTGAWILERNLVPWYAPRSKWAIGSGAEFALAAMHMGHNAPAAIKVACDLDAYTGGKIVTMKYEGPIDDG